MPLSLRTVSFAAFLLGVAVPVALALTPPAWIDEEYRQCVAEAVDHEMDRRIAAQREYGDGQVRDLETYRSELQAAYQIADERGRRDALRNADRANRDRMRETKRVYDDAIREIRNESRDAQRACRDSERENERFIRNKCTSSAQCTGNRVCSTERGVCDPACPPGAERCQEVCAGTCERASSSRSSSGVRSGECTNGGDCPSGYVCNMVDGRGQCQLFGASSSSRSSVPGSPHMWNGYQSNGQVCRSAGECQAGYFCSTVLGECNSPCAPGVTCIQVCQGRCLLYPLDQAAASSSSSRTSIAGTPGANCQPYRCPDGRDFPSCTAEGNPINYFQNPCYS